MRDAVVARWGEDVAPGGAVDRGAVARRAFASDEERGFLEGLLWPRVGRRIAEFRERESARGPAAAALVIEVPLLFESGMDHGFDATIAIVADEEIRRERAAARGHESVDERTARQLTQEEKAAVRHVVANSGTISTSLESRLSGRACQAESHERAGQARDAARRGSRPRPTKAQRQRRRKVLRRRLLLLAVASWPACVLLAVIVRPFADKAVQEISLPLRHEDIIRQQAADKGLDPSLIAGVIYVESRFRDQTSHAGAKGLMQIMPSTADYIARKSGGTAFEQGDLATPQINIAYGSWYLRYLLEHYHGNELLALAAYNAGEGKVDEWFREAAARRGLRGGDAHPVPRDAQLRAARCSRRAAATAQEYRRELGLDQ